MVMAYDEVTGGIARARELLEERAAKWRRAWAHRVSLQAQAQFPGSVVIVKDGVEFVRFDTMPGRGDPACTVIPEPELAAMVGQAVGLGIVIVDVAAFVPPDRLADTWGMPIVELRLCGAAAADPIQAMQTHQAASESLWRLGEC